LVGRVHLGCLDSVGAQPSDRAKGIGLSRRCVGFPGRQRVVVVHFAGVARLPDHRFRHPLHRRCGAICMMPRAHLRPVVPIASHGTRSGVSGHRCPDVTNPLERLLFQHLQPIPINRKAKKEDRENGGNLVFPRSLLSCCTGDWETPAQ
jgi:hypothetical protein